MKRQFNIHWGTNGNNVDRLFHGFPLVFTKEMKDRKHQRRQRGRSYNTQWVQLLISTNSMGNGTVTLQKSKQHQ